MISRREFLKLAGLSTAAFTAGIKIGNAVENSNPVNIYLTAFLPENDFYLNFVVQKFLDQVETYNKNCESVKVLRKLRFSKNNHIYNDLEKVKRVVDGKSVVYSSGDCTISINTLNKEFKSDIFLKDEENSIYQPDKLTELFFIRDEIRNQDAKYKLICEYRSESLLKKFLAGQNKRVIVEVDNVVVEDISLKKNYKQISITGSNGRINFSIENEKAFVTQSNCRNKLCVHSEPIKDLNQNIVCVPNKVIIKISYA